MSSVVGDTKINRASKGRSAGMGATSSLRLGHIPSQSKKINVKTGLLYVHESSSFLENTRLEFYLMFVPANMSKGGGVKPKGGVGPETIALAYVITEIESFDQPFIMFSFS